MLDPREPPHGDFVAFVEKIEREQLARAMQPHKLPQLSAGGKLVATDAGAAARGAASPAAARPAAPGGRGAQIGVAIGAALIAFGLLAEGGIFLALLGAVLLWHNLRRMQRRRADPAASPAQQVDAAFGPPAARAPRRRSG